MARPDKGVTHRRGDWCRHCGVRKIVRPRGLCWRCYYDPQVKKLYHSQSKYAPRETRGEIDPEDDMTQEEVDARVAEQMANLPDWWDHDTTDQRKKNGGGR